MRDDLFELEPPIDELGGGEVALATEIAEWWAECEPLHGLGETIK